MQPRRGPQSRLHVQLPVASSQKQDEGTQASTSTTPHTSPGAHEASSSQPCAEGSGSAHADLAMQALGAPQSSVQLHVPLAASQAHVEGTHDASPVGAHASFGPQSESASQPFLLGSGAVHLDESSQR